MAPQNVLVSKEQKMSARWYHESHRRDFINVLFVGDLLSLILMGILLPDTLIPWSYLSKATCDS